MGERPRPCPRCVDRDKPKDAEPCASCSIGHHAGVATMIAELAEARAEIERIKARVAELDGKPKKEDR